MKLIQGDRNNRRDLFRTTLKHWKNSDNVRHPGVCSKTTKKRMLSKTLKKFCKIIKKTHAQIRRQVRASVDFR